MFKVDVAHVVGGGVVRRGVWVNEWKWAELLFCLLWAHIALLGEASFVNIVCGLDGSTEVGRWCFSAIWIVKPDHSEFQISLMADRDP